MDTNPNLNATTTFDYVGDLEVNSKFDRYFNDDLLWKLIKINMNIKISAIKYRRHSVNGSIEIHWLSIGVV